MLIYCRWCLVSKNGQLAIADHERQTHPQEYWSAKVESLEQQAEQLLAEAQEIKELLAKLAAKRK